MILRLNFGNSISRKRIKASQGIIPLGLYRLSFGPDLKESVNLETEFQITVN